MASQNQVSKGKGDGGYTLSSVDLTNFEQQNDKVTGTPLSYVGLLSSQRNRNDSRKENKSRLSGEGNARDKVTGRINGAR